MKILVVILCTRKNTISKSQLSFQKMFENFPHVTPIYTFNNKKEILENIKESNISGIILGGSESRVLQKDKVDVPIEVFKSNIPILGICYGFQLMIEKLCGETSIGSFKNNDQKIATRYLTIDTPILKVPKSKYYFIHHDFVNKVPTKWSKDIIKGDQIWMAHHNKMIGIQFHPEKYKTSGKRFFQNWIKMLTLR